MSVNLRLPAGFALPAAAGEFTLLHFSEADLAQIHAIEQCSHAYPWSLQNLRSSLTAHSCLGLRHGSTWIAYGVLSFVVGEAELLLFVVDQRWQRRGIGRRFLQELLDLAGQRAETVFLEVRASNQSAIDLYESLGFNQVGVRPNYYPLAGGKREDALLYARDLHLVWALP